ncbi:glycerate kinase type-2 family protein [Brevundimonas aurifodinae]|uniref:DUF4147 domain-containing protein n=2 Tax=Brevundimonas TaxID=41275 RepID=A0ABV1NLX2_9CAUL|nr:MAG: hypothetical protein B7Z01_00430 [Brevundimonas subvibrioides]
MDDPEGFLRSLFAVAVAAASDFSSIPGLIPPTAGRVRVLAAGKAAAAMAAAIEAAPPGWLLPDQMDGLVVTPEGHDLPLSRFEVMTAGHPVPDAGSLAAGERMLALASELGDQDVLVALMSGGASALLAAPVRGATLHDEIDLNRRLLRSGLPISQMNAARSRLSRIKGGGLARAASPARVITFVLSDVPDDMPERVGSGPTLSPSPIALTASTLDILADFPHQPPVSLAAGEVHVVGTAATALAAAARFASDRGVRVHDLGPGVEGEARELARDHARRLGALRREGRPCLLLSGGEATVTMAHGASWGQGGRNTEYLAALLECVGPEMDFWALAADTDGLDGSGPAAGGLLRPDSPGRLRQGRWDPGQALASHDTLPLVASVGQLLMTGPTRTNVNDLRALLVL